MTAPTATDAALASLEPGTWELDPAHSSVSFVARHTMVSKVHEQAFTDFDAQIRIGEHPLESSVVATVQLASVSTGDEKRNGHLRSADFFDVEHHPVMTFRSTGIEPSGDGFLLHGDLSVHEVTRPVTFALEFNGATPDPWGKLRAGFSAEAQLSRKDFDLTWNVALRRAASSSVTR